MTWPFSRSPASRMHRRLLKRLRFAYLTTEDLPDHELVGTNLRLLDKAIVSCHDDLALYPHWFGRPMPDLHADARHLEERLWHVLMTSVHELHTQGFYPDAFTEHVKVLLPIGTALQDLITLELGLVSKPATAVAVTRFERLKVSIAHFLAEAS